MDVLCIRNNAHTRAQVFATAFARVSPAVYPMQWDLANRDIPGVNRTDYYRAACQQCGGLVDALEV